MSKQELPTTWVTAKINDLCHFSKEKGEEGVVPYLEIGNVDIAQKNYTLSGKPSVKGCRMAQQNDVLVSRVRPTRGAIVRIQEEKIPVSSAFSIIRDYGVFTEKYLWSFLAWNHSYLKYLGDNCTGTMYPTTSDAVVGDYEIPIAPIKEQYRIVEKIEELLSEVEASVKELESAQKKLKLYRASVLNAACSGKLVPTEAELARKEKRSYETGEELLQRILKERRENWNGRGTYKEPTAPDLSKLATLPEGWAWSTLGQAFEVFVGATPSRARSDYWGGAVAWVSSGEVAFCPILKTRETITEAGLENSSTTVHPVGTIMLGMIGEGKTRGQVATLKIPAAHNQNTAAIRVSKTEVPPEYVYRFLETLRTSPDFAVINKVTKEVRLIEVKYQHALNPGYVYRYAHRMSESWNPSFLFIATNDGFYFDDVRTICENEGKISPLEHPHIPKELQVQYLQILRDFEGGN